jgi:phospho-N-acetylmuramoyl-pentapeptide-transferase
MLLILFEYFQGFLYSKLHFYAWHEVSFRAVLALLTSLMVSLLWGPKIIRWLVRMKVGDIPEFDHATLNELTRHKANTPTIGWLIILAGVLISTFLWADIRNQFVIKGIFLLVWLGALGGVDDWLKLTAKIKHRSRDGLNIWEKLIFQIGLAVLLASFLYLVDFKEIADGRMLWLPFYKKGIELGLFGFTLMTVLVVTATSNAVNLTDGMDGLATGCMGIVSMVFVILCYMASEPLSLAMNQTWASDLLLPQVPGAGELGIVCAAVLGACLGFLWYNCHPAQVFMGDVGSLPLGGLIGYAAVVTRHELLLPIVGGVFVIEAASVLIQIVYFRQSGGKRIFQCAPLHHHFHLKGWSEPQVVVRFWLLGAAFAALALATLKLR